MPVPAYMRDVRQLYYRPASELTLSNKSQPEQNKKYNGLTLQIKHMTIITNDK